MDRSIRKSITINELDFIFKKNEIRENQQARIVIELFENPQSNRTYLLKEDIRTKKDLENKIRKHITEQDFIHALIQAFYVDDDLLMPNDLRKVLLGNIKMAFFVGAGVSKLLEIPLWMELAGKAIKYLKDKQHINHSEEARLKSEYLPRQIMTIFHEKSSKKEREDFYKKYLEVNKIINNNPYKILFEIEQLLAKPIVKISTNIDLEWWKVLSDGEENQKRIQEPDGKVLTPVLHFELQDSGFTKEQEISEKILYQIHGSLHRIDNAIITTAQYVENYRNDGGLKGFLEKVFKSHIVLFIGSGIQEFEIIEHCIKNSQLRHFALVKTYMGEDNLFRIKKKYFSSINIEPIPYYLDFQGHDRLLFILQSWAEEIQLSKRQFYYEGQALIDEVLSDDE